MHPSIISQPSRPLTGSNSVTKRRRKTPFSPACRAWRELQLCPLCILPYLHSFPLKIAADDLNGMKMAKSTQYEVSQLWVSLDKSTAAPAQPLTACPAACGPEETHPSMYMSYQWDSLGTLKIFSLIAMIVSTLGLRKIPAILNSHVWGGLDRKFEFGWKGLVLPCRGMGNTSLHDPGAALALRAKFILISKLVFTSGSRESAGWLPPLRHRAFPAKMRGSKSPGKIHSHH